ncbi:hypothetical protein EBT31_13965 [bacterium]|jgi:hypothetical protein|nr:hypothetical protein [bacterium]
MWDEIKRTFNVFRTPSALELAARELAQAERALLEAETGREYATAMVEYNQERIHRLRKYLKEASDNS